MGYFWGYSTASTKAALEFTQFKYESEQAYNALLSEKLEQARIYADKMSKLEVAHSKELREQASEFDKTIADLRRSFKPSGVLSNNSAQSGNSGETAPNSSRSVICYTANELRNRVEASLAIAARCDKLAADYNTLLKLIEAYNNAEK